ncbi:MAG TPA: ElyC/SanA/YdcF family protein [Amnibacterium sp.]|nr:ElyC/SanA/YdcF family protein [Amnibacterium sp.]
MRVEIRPSSGAPRQASKVRRRIRRIRRIGLVALASGVVYVLVGLPVFVFPATGPVPAHVDVAFVLGPATQARLGVAERLRRTGVATDVLVSTPGSDPTNGVPALAACNATPHLLCAAPRPTTTRGEARLLAREAAAHHWTSAVVITMPAHISRARLLMGRCFSGTLSMASSGEGPTYGWAYQYLYQTAGTVKALLLPGC